MIYVNPFYEYTCLYPDVVKVANINTLFYIILLCFFFIKMNTDISY